MAEYALLTKRGEVYSIVTTTDTLANVAKNHSDYTVKPVDQVSTTVLERYPYWNERP